MKKVIRKYSYKEKKPKKWIIILAIAILFLVVIGVLTVALIHKNKTNEAPSDNTNVDIEPDKTTDVEEAINDDNKKENINLANFAGYYNNSIEYYLVTYLDCSTNKQKVKLSLNNDSYYEVYDENNIILEEFSGLNPSNMTESELREQLNNQFLEAGISQEEIDNYVIKLYIVESSIQFSINNLFISSNSTCKFNLEIITDEDPYLSEINGKISFSDEKIIIDYESYEDDIQTILNELVEGSCEVIIVDDFMYYNLIKFHDIVEINNANMQGAYD